MLNIIKKIDKPLLIVSIILFAIGLISIFSASNVTAFMLNDADPSRYFMKELVFLLGSIVIAGIVIIFPSKYYAKISWFSTIILGISIVVLTLLGQVVNGISAWVNYNGLGIQPSEFVKVSIIPLIATFYETNIKNRDNFWRMMVPMIVAAFVALAMVLQKDLGTAIIFTFLCILMFFFSPVTRKIKFKVFGIGITLCAVFGLIMVSGGYKLIPEDKLARFDLYDPCSKYVTTGNQLCNGYIAINGGGLTGKGLGNSTQKYLYLPEAHTDFIFAIYIEEIGIIGAVILLSLYFVLIVRIIVIGKGSSSVANTLICYGVAFYIFMHIMVNLTGVLGILPMTGVPLPFMSYGGSICLSIMVALTLVQRIAYENKIKYQKS